FIDRFLNSNHAAMGGSGSDVPFSFDRTNALILVNPPGTLPGSTAYTINSLELIGIAKHNAPVAFPTIRHAPAISTPARPLTDFEPKALAQLRTGVDTTTAVDQSTRQVVGAIRAQNSCLRCHTGFKEGDLLGAFTYHLTQTPVAPPLGPSLPAISR